MHIQELNGKEVCILGYGREGKAMLEALKKHAPNAKISIADADAGIKVAGCTLHVGDSYLEHLGDCDVVIKSPGIPPKTLESCNLQPATVISSTQIFFHTIADSGAIVVGVTGSKGKSTTASLLHAILKTAGKDTHLVGNIGEPAISHLEDAHRDTIFVHEMSSYQLMDLQTSPHVAVITSFFPEHLDYHGSLEAYREAKEHICRFQTENDYVFFDAASEGATAIAACSPGRRIGAHAEDLPLPAGALRLQGEHNRRNAALAYLVAGLWRVPDSVSLPVIQEFAGLPHRLQSLGVIGGIEWVDDAISTTPESCIAALDALGDRVTTVILGGQDRGNDFTELGTRIVQSNVHTVILFPGSGPRIQAAIEEAIERLKPDRWITFSPEIATMTQAVAIAHAHAHQSTNQPLPAEALAKAGINPSTSHPPIVLLSTASPSYGMFKNFEEKGATFQADIERLVGKMGGV